MDAEQILREHPRLAIVNISGYREAPKTSLEVGVHLLDRWLRPQYDNMFDPVMPRERFQVYMMPSIFEAMVSPYGVLWPWINAQRLGRVRMRVDGKEELLDFSRYIIGDGMHRGIVWYLHPNGRYFGELNVAGTELACAAVIDSLESVAELIEYEVGE